MVGHSMAVRRIGESQSREQRRRMDYHLAHVAIFLGLS
jgi:hypothetical protein